MDFNESMALKLISEMKKPGRECLYDMSNKSYKNNHIKQGVWSTIATSTGMGRIECQALWKSLRRRYKTAKSKNIGSERLKLKGFLKVLVAEMDYFQKFWEDSPPSTSKEIQKRKCSQLADAETDCEESLSIALKLISEMKKPGRECLYDMSNKSYKNNHIKQGVWSTIATSTGMGRSECQALWKSLRRKYKSAKSKNLGSERLKLKGFLNVLVTEMDYFQKVWEDSPPSTSNETQKRKPSRLGDAESVYEESLKTLNKLASSVIQSTAEKVDPFFLTLQDEFLKVPENQKSALKLKLMTLVIEHQSS